MKNKKGFTLVELLAVMLLLILLILIAFPNFPKLSSQAKNKYDNTVNVLLRSAASMYVNNHTPEMNSVLTTTSSEYCLTIGKLIRQEYLDSEIKDSKGTEILPEYCIIVKKKTLNPVEYEYTVPSSTNTRQASDFGITNIYEY